MNRFRFTRSLLLCFLLTAALFLGGCGDLVQLSGLLLDTSTSVSLPSAAADARAPGLSAVMATASGQEGENRPASAGQSSGSGTASANLSPYYENFSIFLPKLNEAEYTNFIALYQGIRTFREKITLPLPASSDEVQKLMTLLSNDCPELMQLGSQWGQNSNLLGSVISVSPTYICGREEWERQNAEITQLIEGFHAQLEGCSKYQAELAVYDYIISHCAYNSDSAYAQSPYGALIAGQAKCDGRAKAMVWALRSFGILSSVITGSEHAWVLLYLDGYYYNADPTYDDNEPGGRQAPCSYAHFNIPASAIATGSYPADDIYTELEYPATIRWDSNYHVKSGLWVFAGQDPRPLFEAQLAQAAAAGEGIVSIRFETPEDCQSALENVSAWVQDYLNLHMLNCNMTSYDLQNMNMIFLYISFR